MLTIGGRGKTLLHVILKVVYLSNSWRAPQYFVTGLLNLHSVVDSRKCAYVRLLSRTIYVLFFSSYFILINELSKQYLVGADIDHIINHALIMCYDCSHKQKCDHKCIVRGINVTLNTGITKSVLKYLNESKARLVFWRTTILTQPASI